MANTKNNSKKTKVNEKKISNQNTKKEKKLSLKEIITKGLVHFKDEDKKVVEKNVSTIVSFSEDFLKKHKDKTLGIAVIPQEFSVLDEDESEAIKKSKEDKTKPHVLILIDDKKLKDVAKDKVELINYVVSYSKDKPIIPEILLLSELWQMCYDSKFSILKGFVISSVVYENGMLSALRVAEVHKAMILEKFEKYIVSYVLAGSLVRGEATPKSDVDVFVVIDDTDVKRMPRAELKHKLRSIILEAGFFAGNNTGVQNKLNIQTYLLTEFWESLKEANPVIFTFLRDGIPMYDRGIFLPWKQLLRMGMIQPSPEAVERFMDSGEKFIDNVKDKLKELAIEELFYAVVNPSQAAIMKYGLTPPVPKEAANLMKEIFVVKEKLLTEKDVKIVEKAVKIRKDVEHGIKKSVSGKELGELLSDAEKYLKKIKEIYNEIEIKKDLELIVKIYDDALTILRNILIQEDVKKISETEILSVFEEKVIKTGKLPNVVLRDLKVLFNAYNDYEKGKLKKLDISKIKNKANATMRGLIEYLQSMNFKKIEDAKVRFEYGKEMVGEIYLIDDNYYVLKSVSEDNSFLVFDKKYKFLKEIEKEEFNEIKLNGKIHKIKLKKELLSVIEKELKTPICIVV